MLDQAKNLKDVIADEAVSSTKDNAKQLRALRKYLQSLLPASAQDALHTLIDTAKRVGLEEALSVSAAAERQAVTTRCMNAYLMAGRVPGARQIGSTWVVPGNFVILPGSRGQRMRNPTVADNRRPA